MSIAIYDAQGALIQNNGSNGISILGPDGALMPNNGSNGVSILDINGARQLADGVVDEYSILGTDGALAPYAGSSYSILALDGSLYPRLGPELITNGIFADNGSSWFLGNGAVDFTGEVAKVTNADASVAYIRQNILTIGKAYHIEVDVVAKSGGSGAVTLGATRFPLTTGRLTFEGICTSNVQFRIDTNSSTLGHSITVDNVSVKEIQGVL